MGIEHAVTKRGRIILPLALSAGLALSGCATTFPSSEQVREKKQKSALEKATYSSIYEESFMRGLPQGEDRDYYAGVWSFAKNWMTPVDIKKEFLDSLSHYSVVEDKRKVDSLISVYTMEYNKSIVDTVSSFERAIREAAKICNNKWAIHPNENYASKYYDDLGNRILLEMVRAGVSKDNIRNLYSTIGVHKDDHRRIGSTKATLEGPEVATYKIDWKDGRGDTYYQEDMSASSGWWKVCGDEVSEMRASAEKDIVKRQTQIKNDVVGELHRLSQRPVSVGDTATAIKSGVVDVGIEVVLDPQTGSYRPVLNLGGRYDNFVFNDTLNVKGKYVIKRLGDDKNILLQGDIDIAEFVSDFDSKKGKGYVNSTQGFLPALPSGIGKGKLETLVLGWDIYNAKNEHDKRHMGFSVGQIDSNFYIGRGWIVTGNKQVSSKFVGGVPPDAFENYIPGDTVNFLLTNNPTSVNGDKALVRFRFTSINDKKKQTGEYPPVTVKGFKDIGDALEQIIDSTEMADELDIGYLKGDVVANITPNGSGINVVPIEIPKLKEGHYDVKASWYAPDSTGTMRNNAVTMIRGIYVNKK